jgi:hypothetical protein
VNAAYALRSPVADVPVPPRSDYAALQDEAKIPFVGDGGRKGYRSFLEQGWPRAFAIAPNSSWGWAEGGAAPLQRALDNCNRRGAGTCRLYAVDADVVWKDQP